MKANKNYGEGVVSYDIFEISNVVSIQYRGPQVSYAELKVDKYQL